MLRLLLLCCVLCSTAVAQKQDTGLACRLKAWGLRCETPEGFAVVGVGPNSLRLSGNGVISVVVTAEEDIEKVIAEVLQNLPDTFVEEPGDITLPLNGHKARARSFRGRDKEGVLLLRVFAVVNPSKGTAVAVFGLGREATFKKLSASVDALGKSIQLGDIVLNVPAMGRLVGAWKKVSGDGETTAITFLENGDYERTLEGKTNKGRFAVIGSVLVLREHETGETLHIPMTAKNENELFLGKLGFLRVK